MQVPLKTKLAGLDLSDADSLEKIGAKTFRNTRITDTIETPFNVPTYKANSFPKGISIVSTISPSPSPPPSPPSPASSPPPPPYTFTSTASLKTAVKAVNANLASAIATYGPVADWDVSGVSDMSELFKEDDETYSYGGVIDGVLGFNADISNWNTSSVTDMSRMFWVRSAHGRMP